MTLRKKNLLIMGVMLVGLFAMLYAVSQTAFWDSFSKLEKQDTSQNVERAQAVLSDDISRLASIVGDWAPWDDTYNFVEDLDESYVQSNLSDAAITNLGINIMLFVNSSGQVVYGKAFDLQNEEEIPVPQGLQEYISASDHPASKFVAESGISGIILSSEGPMLIASHQIMTSEHKGPIRGALIMGRFLDSAEIDRLAETTHLSLTVYRFDEPQMPADFDAARSALSGNEAIFVMPLDSKSVAGYTLIKDIDGEPALVLRADMPRVIYHQGQTSLIYFISLLVVVSLLFVVMVVLLLERFVLSPLSRLNSSVKDIGEKEDLSAQVAVGGKDEVSSLGVEINRMLKALKQSHEALRESELIATTTIEGMADGVMLVAMDGKVTYVNKAFQKLLGHKAEEIVGTSALELPTYRNSKDRERAREALKMLIEKGSAKAVDMTAITKDGEEIPISFNASLIKDAQGNPKILVAVLRDVTERRWAEEALQRSERYFRSLIENSHDATVIVGEDVTMTYGTPSIERMLGYKQEELIGTDGFSYGHPDDMPLVMEAFARLGENPEGAVRVELRIRHKDGSWRIVDAVAKNLLGDEAVKGIVINWRDVTEHKKAEEELKGSERKHRQLIESMQEGLWVIDNDSYTTFVNPRMAEILGYTADEMQGKHLFLFMDEHGIEIAKYLLERRQQGIKEQHDFEFMRKDGKRVYVSMETSPILDDEGNYVGALACVADVTKRREIEEALRSSEEKLRLYLDNSPDGIYINDVKANFLYGNRAAERLVGYSREELLGKSFWELGLLSEEYWFKAAQLLERNFVGEPTGPDELELIRKDGARVFVEISTYPVGEGDKLEVIGIARDITERRKMEEKLRRLSDAVGMTTDCILITDPEGRIVDLNEATLRMFGTDDRADLIGRASTDLVLSEEQDKAFEEMAATRESGQAREVKYHVTIKDGSTITVEANSSIMRAVNGEPMGFVVVCRDITERERMEEELRLLSDAIKMTSESVAIVDLKGRIVDINEAGLRMYGLDNRADLVGKNPLDIIVTEDQPKALENMSKIVETGSVKDIEYHIMRKDGKKVLIETSVSLLRGEGGKPKGLVAVARDITERRRMEEALRYSEEYFRALTDNSSDAITVLDADGTVCYESTSLKRMLGYTAGERVGQNGFDFIHPDDLSSSIEEFAQLLKNQGATIRKELRAKHQDGSWINIELVGTNLVNNPAVGGIVVNCRDITERKKAEEALRVKDWAIESSINAIAMSDLAGNLTYINRAFLRLWGYRDGREVLGKPVTEFWQSAEGPDRVIKVLQSQGSWQGGMVARSQDGSSFDVETAASLVVDSEGKPLCMMAAFVDVTERKKAEDALKLSEERYRLLVENANEAIVVAQDGMLKFFNSRAIGLSGYSKEEMADKPFIELIHPDDQQMVAGRYMVRLRGEGLPSFYSFRVVDRAGNVRWVEISAVAINWEGRAATLNFLTDVTERKKAEEEKQKMEEQLLLAGRLAAVGELSAGVAHELNNPIAAIQGFAQLLTARSDLDETTKKDLGIVYREAQRAAKITQNLLSFARRHEPDKQLVSLNEVIEKTLELRAHQMKVNNIELVVDFAADLPKTMADFFQMQQVFVNIINNAEQAMVGAHGKGRLVVKTQKAGDMVRISFADDGPGISEENMKRMFDPFFTTKEVGKGTGLGLSICFGLVEAHGGRLYARSKLGQGATFVVEIPIVSVVAEGQ